MGKQVWQCEECKNVYPDESGVRKCEEKHEEERKRLAEEIEKNKKMIFNKEVK